MKRVVAVFALALALSGCRRSAAAADDAGRPLTLGPPLGVAWGFLYGYSGVPAETFVPQLRALGGSWTKLYLIWNQVEPERGRYDWTAVDAFLGQLQSPEEGLIAVFSSSTWATRTAVTMLPPSPARDAFDLFDLRLYADPYTIPARVAFMRKKMIDLGYERPIVSTEYNGPGFFEFAEKRAHIPLMLEWSKAVSGTQGGPPQLSRKAEEGVAGLYAKRDELAPATQMFLQGAPPELEERFARLQGRDLVIRNVMALSAGVQRTMFWDFWHDTSKRDDLMTLMYGKFKLFEYEGGRLQKRLPLAEAFKRMSDQLAGVTLVRRRHTSDRPTVFAYDVERSGRPPLLVVWDRRDALYGEGLPPLSLELAWPAASAQAMDALGASVPVSVRDGRVHVPVSVTPVFVEAAAQ